MNLTKTWSKALKTTKMYSNISFHESEHTSSGASGWTELCIRNGIHSDSLEDGHLFNVCCSSLTQLALLELFTWWFMPRICPSDFVGLDNDLIASLLRQSGYLHCSVNYIPIYKKLKSILVIRTISPGPTKGLKIINFWAHINNCYQSQLHNLLNGDSTSTTVTQPLKIHLVFNCKVVNLEQEGSTYNKSVLLEGMFCTCFIL